MEKMQRFEIIDYGFAPQPRNDARLTEDGDDFNDYGWGYGWDRRSAIQSAISFIISEGIQPPAELTKIAGEASAEEHPEDLIYNVAIRFYRDKSKEEAAAAAKLSKLIEDNRARKQAVFDESGFPEEASEVSFGTLYS